MLPKRKRFTAEVEYGPQREDARISLAQKGAQETLAQTGRPDARFPRQAKAGKASRGSQWLRRASLGASGSLKFTFHSFDATASLSECFCRSLPTVTPGCFHLSFLCCSPGLCSQLTVTVSGGDQVGRRRGLSQGPGLRPRVNLDRETMPLSLEINPAGWVEFRTEGCVEMKSHPQSPGGLLRLTRARQWCVSFTLCPLSVSLVCTHFHPSGTDV